MAPSAVHASLGAAEAAAAQAMSREASQPDAPLPLADVDPDVLEKAYQLPADQAFAASQEPERWLQTYLKGPADEGRAWTDEEYQNEARWIFHQVFLRRGYERAITENAIVRVLSQLHDKKLEMIYIVEHVYWMVAKALTKEDLWKIQEYKGRVLARHKTGYSDTFLVSTTHKAGYSDTFLVSTTHKAGYSDTFLVSTRSTTSCGSPCGSATRSSSIGRKSWRSRKRRCPTISSRRYSGRHKPHVA